MEVNKEKYAFEDIETEHKQIEDSYLSLRFAQKIRHEVLACYKKCNGKIRFPFRPETGELTDKEEVCFGDCLNLNFERGPFLNELGTVPDDVIPKKFIWPHSL